MTKLLISAADGAILIAAEAIVDDGTAYRAGPAILPKHVLPETVLIVETELPEGANLSQLMWNGSAIVRRPLAENVLAALKAARNKDINRWREEANSATFPYLGKHIQCDPLSTVDILGTALSIALTGDFPPNFPGAWKFQDNSYVALPSVEDFKPLYSAFTQRGSLNFMHAQELKNAVAAATSAEELDSIHW